MNGFLSDNYLLENETAAALYHDYAKGMPIFDYHCHISPREIAEDKTYENITQLWLYGDHYKWRAMRANGIDERLITGDADDKSKFLKWAETLPYLIGNPLYLWSHLELRRYFGVDTILSPATAEEIWAQCNRVLAGGGFSVRSIIEKSNVAALCTTDNPVDTLEAHRALRSDATFKTAVLPAFRPDVFINIEKPDFLSWVNKLADAAKKPITSLGRLQEALGQRIIYFHENGCRLSDHALDPIVYEECSEDEAAGIFQKALDGSILSDSEIQKYKTWMLLFLGREYAKRGWVMQYHLSAVRNINTRMFNRLGPDTGFDATGDWRVAAPLQKILDSLDRTGELPKTILYSLNPGDYEVLLSVGGGFGGDVPGKLQLGSAWWFNDHKPGIERQLTALANQGLLGRFIGMTTDSRSFLSYTRHEYFRRILCNLLGRWAENSEIPSDMEILGGTVKNICFNNIADYMGLSVLNRTAGGETP
jgi:glucuronate isomerase